MSMLFQTQEFTKANIVYLSTVLILFFIYNLFFSSGSLFRRNAGEDSLWLTKTHSICLVSKALFQA